MKSFDQTADNMKQSLVQNVETVNMKDLISEEFHQDYKRALKFSNLKLQEQLHYRNVRIYEKDHIHEVYTKGKQLPHLVLLHGYGGTSLTFVRLFEHLRNHFQIHALDTFGIGLSSKGHYNEKMKLEEVKKYYVEAIEEWRKTVGIQNFVLAGHSFGGYIATLYWERFPEKIDRLILMSPAGNTRLTQQEIDQKNQNAPFKRKAFYCFAETIYNRSFRPFGVMNTCFIGNRVMDKILTNRLKLEEQQKNAWKKYLKHIIINDQTSETGFYKIFSWPLRPEISIEDIINNNNCGKKSIEFYFGDNDWMESAGAKRLIEKHKNVIFESIKNAGHQLIFDNPIDISQKIIKNHKQK